MLPPPPGLWAGSPLPRAGGQSQALAYAASPAGPGKTSPQETACPDPAGALISPADHHTRPLVARPAGAGTQPLVLNKRINE